MDWTRLLKTIVIVVVACCLTLVLEHLAGQGMYTDMALVILLVLLVQLLSYLRNKGNKGSIEQ